VTVTYGDRFGLLEQVLHALLQTNIGHVIVVNNASATASQQALYTFVEQHANTTMTVLTMPNNLGSAGGYKAGIEAALETNCDFVWLLDDDNVPADDAFGHLQDAYAELTEPTQITPTQITPTQITPTQITATLAKPTANYKLLALCALRDDRANLKAWAQGVRTAITRPSRVLGFHLLDIPSKVLARFHKKTPCTLCPLPFAPYGGMLLPRGVIDTIGTPDPRFYLYSDDYEYSYRITEQGGQIMLVPASRIIDVDTSWHVRKKKTRALQQLFITPSDERIFYATRNAIYWTRHVRKGNYAWYLLNFTLVRIGIAVEALLARDVKRWRLLARAVREGARGKLGKTF
jgi:GT2 family glycosyltransferase